MSSNRENDIRSFKIHAIKAAKDFRYGDDVIKRIRTAKSEGEVSRIMQTARHKMFG